LAILGSQPPVALLFVAAALAGAGSNGTANLLYGYVGSWFPSVMRAPAIGSFISLARIGGIMAPIAGGWLIATGISTGWSFLAPVIPAALGAVIALILPRKRASATPGEKSQ
jgi:MFS transporter, AAHS family, benzoate transport protein